MNPQPLSRPIRSFPLAALALTAIAVSAVAQSGGSPAASLVLARALRNHHEGDFAAAVTCIRDSYLSGRDTLTGILEIRDAESRRRLTLRGTGGAFEWWSRRDGREQWRREGEAGRLRRLPPHSFKKPAFAPDVSYEDLARLPFGYLDARRLRGLRDEAAQTDSVQAEFAPDGGLAALYSSLTATVGIDPALLRRVDFEGVGARPSRRMTIVRYIATPKGWFPAEIVFEAADGLSSVRLLLEPLPQDAVRDKAASGGGAGDDATSFATPRWIPREDGGPAIGPGGD